MNFRRFASSRWGKVILFILAGAAVFLVALPLVALFSPPWPSWRGWDGALESVCLLALAGACYGAIAALDGRSPVAEGDHPVLRTLLCAAFGAAAVLVRQWWGPAAIDHAWVGGGAVIGGVLGWLGWAWAKYINF